MNDLENETTIGQATFHLLIAVDKQ